MNRSYRELLTVLGTTMLSLGMGASIVVFSIFQSALLKPLPFRDADRLLTIWESSSPK